MISDLKGLAEQVYSLGIAHLHTLDNTITSCAIPLLRASEGAVLGEKIEVSWSVWDLERVSSASWVSRVARDDVRAVGRRAGEEGS